jgi:hypothetical protein
MITRLYAVKDNVCGINAEDKKGKIICHFVGDYVTYDDDGHTYIHGENGIVGYIPYKVTFELI